ncbi:MAG: cyclic pyranopterin monophosphate synthase MoaC [Ignavibacteriaceae bacterium]
MSKLTHTNSKGKAEMVDISDKDDSLRTAEAYAEVSVSDEVFEKIKENKITKGDVLTTARLAGIQAAKRTSELIPLCHNILISKVKIDIKLNSEKISVEINAVAKTVAKTGIEMEALTAASVSALTIYDMCKSVDKSIVIKEIKLISKTGGKSGDFRNVNP